VNNANAGSTSQAILVLKRLTSTLLPSLYKNEFPNNLVDYHLGSSRAFMDGSIVTVALSTLTQLN